MKKRIIAFILAAFFSAGLSGCAQNPPAQSDSSGGDAATLKIAFDSSRYGDGWMKRAAAEFEKRMPGIKTELIPEADSNGQISRMFSAGGTVPDVILMKKTNWQYFAQKGWIISLDDVYQSAEEGKKLSERLQPELAGFGRYNNKWYVVPWSVEVTGILYNSGMFEKNGWTPPSDFSELSELMQKIRQSGIAPFVWAGKSPDLWNNVVLGWWVQDEGIKGIKTYLQMKSPEVYGQKGRLDALEEFQLIALESGGNSLKGCGELDESSMMSAFFRGRAAMIPGSSALYEKYRSSMPKGFTMKIMRLPSPDGAAEPDANFLSAGDFLCIPSAGRNRALAEQFIRFLVSSRTALWFENTVQTPSALNINYNGSDVFTSSVSELYGTTEKVYLYSDQPVYYNHFLDWPFSGMPYLQISSGQQTAQSIYDGNCSYVKQYWSRYTQ